MKYSGGRSINFPSCTTTSPDGTRLRYFDTGSCGDQAHLPVVVLANGLGGPVSAWRPYLKRWTGRYRLIAWDYRGCYGSVPNPGRPDLSVPAHALDLTTILDHARVESAAYVGWSMGVQVGLEFHVKNPGRLSHLTLISGTYGRPLRSVPLPFAEQALTPLIQGASRLRFVGQRLLSGASRSALTFPALRALGVIAEGLPHAHYQRMVEDFTAIDLDLYFQLLAELGRHDAESTMPHIRIPALIVAGSRDILTPPSLARRIAREIPGAELFVISGATHYSTVEYPDVIAHRLERFMERPSPSLDPETLTPRPPTSPLLRPTFPMARDSSQTVPDEL